MRVVGGGNGGGGGGGVGLTFTVSKVGCVHISEIPILCLLCCVQQDSISLMLSKYNNQATLL